MRQATDDGRSSSRVFDMRRSAAVIAGKASAAASRALGRGGGTALPGLVANRVAPSLVRDLALQLDEGAVVVSGTNGKTTTARMLGMIASNARFTPLRNESGSNLMRGLASSLIQRASLTGKLPSGLRTLGLFEVDEAALPEILSVLRPRAVLLLDLFRDQLDRYGEVATVARLWEEGLRRLPSTTALIANADDPLVASVAGSALYPVSYFGIESLGHQPAHRIEASPEHASDVKACPRCAGPIHYTAIFFGHLGHYACSACGFSRPNPQVKAARVELDGVGGSRFQLISEEGEATLRFPLPGLYNIYNALGAATGAMDLDLELGLIARTLEMVTPAFGRMERLLVENRDTYLALAKNPTGLNEVIRTLVAGGEPLHLLVMLNDNTADGRDVSWIWDADVEMLQGRVAAAVFAGTRAEDMALRFKYAAVIGAEDGPRWEVRSDTRRALEDAIRLTPEGRRLFIVPTYTALLDVRNTLTRLGYVRPYWEE